MKRSSSSPKSSAPSARRQPVVRKSAVERVAQRLEELVRSGELKRGSRLPAEPRLAELLGVSRAALREATKGLVFLGVLRARAGDGTYLQPTLGSTLTSHLQWMVLLEEVKYLELYELREILEPVVAGLAARRATPDDLQLLREALQGMKASTGSPRDCVRFELDFHDTITQAAKNRAIASMMQMMYGALAEGRSRVLPLVTDLRTHCERHENIYRLIAAGEATLARKAVKADLRYAEMLLDQSLRVGANAPPSQTPAANRNPHANRSKKIAAKGPARPSARATRIAQSASTRKSR